MAQQNGDGGDPTTLFEVVKLGKSAMQVKPTQICFLCKAVFIDINEPVILVDLLDTGPEVTHSLSFISY